MLAVLCIQIISIGFFAFTVSGSKPLWKELHGMGLYIQQEISICTAISLGSPESQEFAYSGNFTTILHKLLYAEIRQNTEIKACFGVVVFILFFLMFLTIFWPLFPQP